MLTSFLACSDNATKLAHDIESGVNQLQSQDEGSEYTIRYKPVHEKQEAYTIVFLPEKETISDDLIKKGVDPYIAKDIFSRLSYINIGKGAMLIVYQAGKISFTTFHRRFVSVSDIQVANSKGETNIVLKKIDKEHIILELH